MKLLDSVLARFGYRRLDAQKREIKPGDPYFHLARLNVSAKGLRTPYRQHAWVYACIRRIATNIAGLPLRIYTGDRENPKVIESGPLYEIFNRPNSIWTRYHLIEAIVTHMQLSGNAVMILDRERDTREPREIKVFPKDRFEAKFAKDQLTHLEFHRVNGTKVKIQPYQFLIHRYFNPYNNFWGMGPLEAAQEGVVQDYLASQFNRAYFENGANPGGAITVKGGLGPDQRKQYQQLLKAKYEGPDKAFKTMLLEGDVDYKQYEIKHKDMCFLEQKKWSRDEICATFGVPKAELSVYEDINYATAQSADKSFWQKTLIPICRLIESSFDAQFFIPYNRDKKQKCWLKFDLSVVEALQEDFNEKVKTSKTLFDMGVPFNKINEKLELGFEPIDSGDVGYLPIGLVEAGTDPYVDSDDEKEAPKAEKAYKPLIEVYDRTHTPEQEIAWKTFVRTLDPLERRYFLEMRRYMSRVKKWQLKQIEKYNEPGSIDVEDVMLTEAWDMELRHSAAKHYKQVAVKYGPVIETNLAKIGIDFAFNAKDPILVSYLKTKTNKIVGINDRMRAMVRDKIAESVEKNQTIQELSTIISNTMQSTKKRGLDIARTETTSAANGISFRCHTMVGLKKHMWVAALDEVTRISHLEAMALGGITIGQVFGPTGCRYPGDEQADPGEIINCRCDLIPTE